MELRPVTTTVKTPAERLLPATSTQNPIFNGDGASFLLEPPWSASPPARGQIGSLPRQRAAAACTGGVGLVVSPDAPAPSFACGPATSVWTPPDEEHPARRHAQTT